MIIPIESQMICLLNVRREHHTTSATLFFPFEMKFEDDVTNSYRCVNHSELDSMNYFEWVLEDTIVGPVSISITM